MDAMAAIIFTALGAALYRFRGSGSRLLRFFPRPIPQAMFALPYALACAAAAGWLAAVAVLALCTAATATGHGKFMALGFWPNGKPQDETLEFLIKPLESRLSPYWYCGIGLALTGLAVTVLPGVILQSPLLALSGVLKFPAYAIGHGFYQGQNRAIIIGEALTGAAFWGLLLVSIT